MQTEDNAKQASLFLLLRCRLSYQEIVQTEDNTKQACLFLHILRNECLPSLVIVEYSYLNDMTLVFVTIFYQLYSLRFAWTFWLYSFRCFSIGCLCCCMAAIVWIDCVVSATVSIQCYLRLRSFVLSCVIFALCWAFCEAVEKFLVPFVLGNLLFSDCYQSSYLLWNQY